jgi:hypothetical protein
MDSNANKTVKQSKFQQHVNVAYSGIIVNK